MEKTENSNTPIQKETFLSKLKGKQKNTLEDRVRHIKDAICAGSSKEVAVSNSSNNHKQNDYLYQQYEIVSKLSGFLNTCLERESLMHQVNNELIETVKGMSDNTAENEVLHKIREFSTIHQESFQALRSAIDIWHEIRNTMEVFAQESQKINISYIIYDESECKDTWMNIQNVLKDIIGTSSNESVKTRLKDISNQFSQVCDTIEQKEKDFWRKQQQFSQITWKMQQLNNLSDCLMQEYKHNKCKVDDLVKFASQLKKQLQKSEEEKLDMAEKLQQTKDTQNNEFVSSNGMQLVKAMKDELSQYKNTVNTLKTKIYTLEQQLQDQQTTAIDFNDLLGLWQASLTQNKQVNESVDKGPENSHLTIDSLHNSLCTADMQESSSEPPVPKLIDDPSEISSDKATTISQAVNSNLSPLMKLRTGNNSLLPKLPLKSLNCFPPSPKLIKNSKSPVPSYRNHCKSPTRCNTPSEAVISISPNQKSCLHCTQSQCNIIGCNCIHLQSENGKMTGDVKENDCIHRGMQQEKYKRAYGLDKSFKYDNELKKSDDYKAVRKSINSGLKPQKLGCEEEKYFKEQTDWKLLQQLTDYERKIYFLKDHLHHEKARHEAEVRKAENSFMRSLKHDEKDGNNIPTSQQYYEKQIHHLQDYLDHERLRHEAELRKIEIAHKKQMVFLQKDCVQILKNINRFKENIVNMFEKEQFHIDAVDVRDIETIDVGLENGLGDVVTLIGRATPKTLAIFNGVETKLLQALSHLKYLYSQDHLLSGISIQK